MLLAESADPLVRWSFCWRWKWRLGGTAISFPSKIWFSILFDCLLLPPSGPIRLCNSTIDLSSSTLEGRVIRHAQGALMPGPLNEVFAKVLARELRMVVHVAEGTVHSLIF